MEKINVLTLGGCAAIDILKSNRNHINIYDIDPWLGSFSRQMWPTNKVAARFAEHFYTIMNNIQNDPNHDEVVMQIWYTLKRYRTPSILIKNLPPNSVVIIDPAYEIKNFYFDGDEIFDLSLKYHRIVKNYMPEWFNDLVDKHYTHFDCGITEIATFQYRAVRKFLKELKRANVPVIAIDNVFTDRVFDYRTNSIATAISTYNSRMPFGKLHSTDTDKHKYSIDLIDRFYENWRDIMPAEFKLFSPDRNMLYADTNHHLGYHPTHLHHTCRVLLEKELSTMIAESVAAHRAKQPIILPNINKTF